MRKHEILSLFGHCELTKTPLKPRNNKFIYFVGQFEVNRRSKGLNLYSIYETIIILFSGE